MQHNINPPLLVLADLIEQATNYIISESYSESAIKGHIRIWRHLQEFGLVAVLQSRHHPFQQILIVDN